MYVYKPNLCIFTELVFSMQVQVSSETKDIGIVYVLAGLCTVQVTGKVTCASV